MDTSTAKDSFHHFSRGRPNNLVFQKVSSSAVPPHQRYEFWTDAILRGVDVAKPTESQRADFHANIVSLATASSELHMAEFSGYSETRTRAHIRADGLADTALAFVLGGRLNAEHDGGVRQSLGPGDFFLASLSQPTRFHSHESGWHRIAQILLPRACLNALFPKKLPSPDAFTQALSASSLSPFLGAHLRDVAALATTLAPADQEALLKASESFVSIVLEGVFAAGVAREGHRHEVLFVAAKRHMQRHLSNPTLNPDRVAQALGCSRATLYRAFTTYGETVNGALREMRLQRARSLLANVPANLTVGGLATQCGFKSVRSFHRAFRERFGVSPRDAQKSVGFPRP